MTVFHNKNSPDFNGFKENILHQKKPSRVYFAEFFQDKEIKNQVAERFGLLENLKSDKKFFELQKEIAIQSFLGYDMICPKQLMLRFPNDSEMSKGKNSSSSSDIVANGPIQSWEDFESYKWPDPNDLNFELLEWLEDNLPENMKSYCMLPVGTYKMLIGYESIYYMIYDNPELFKSVIDKLEEIFTKTCDLLCQFSCVGVIWAGDDMGHKTQTFFPPEFIEENILPLHKACSDIAHMNEKMYFLHSCGNLESIMDLLINYVNIDAKHSFEDAICPIEDMWEVYASEVSLIGGVDVDLLCRATEKEIRCRIREILDKCQASGGYCLGSGNSIAKYIPLENYLIMLDEGQQWSS